MLACNALKLFEPCRIGSMELRNRIVMPALNTKFSSEQGAVTPRLSSYYEERAKGGVALIIVESTCVDWPVGKDGCTPVRIDSDVFTGGLSDLADAVHIHGAKIAAQLSHTGRQTTLAASEGVQPVAPSAIPWGASAPMPRELTTSEIGEIVEKFGLAAWRVKMAGFDAVEIHGAHGYLITQFLSPYTNRRTDAYGGTFERRMRFPLEVLAAIKRKVGDDFPILFRLSADEFVQGGLMLEQSKEICACLERHGVDAFDVSGGIYESLAKIFPPMSEAPGSLVHLAAGIKESVSKPVIAVGRLGDPELAERILREGKADMVALGRSLIADPEWPAKARAGLTEDMRPCLACNQGCLNRLRYNLGIRCTVNPMVGHEWSVNMRTHGPQKRVVILGAGPAGLSAALSAADLGYGATVFESQEEIGGMLRAAARAPHKDTIGQYLEYLRCQTARRHLKIRFGEYPTPADIMNERPDAVILAIGSEPIVPDMPGVTRQMVAMATDVLLDKVRIDGRVVVIGGGQVGCETGEYLAERGCTVTVVEMREAMATDAEAIARRLLLERLCRLGVRLEARTRVVQVQDSGVLVMSSSGGMQLLESDHVVLAAGFKPRTYASRELEDAGVRVSRVGDCSRVRTLMEAVQEGYHVVKRL